MSQRRKEMQEKYQQVLQLKDREFEVLPSGKGEQVTAYAKAGFFSLASFSWVAPLLALGSRRPLDSTDLPKLAPGDTAAAAYALLSKVWMEEKKRACSSGHYCLARSILRVLWKNLAITAILVAVNTICSYVGPYLIDDLVQYLAGAGKFRQQGLVLAMVLLLTKLVEKVARCQWIMGGNMMRLRIESALKALVYQKGLRLSNPSRQMHTSGDIVNYITVDISQVTGCVWYVHTAWQLPLQITLALLILYKNVGIAAFAALVASVATIWLNVPFTRMQEKYQEQIMKAKDVRMRSTAECLRCMKVIKLQGWEKAFFTKLKALREVEYGWLKLSSFARAAGIFIFYISPALVGVITFGTCILLKVPLSAGRVLSALATFQVLQQPLNVFPDALSAVAQARVSLERLSRFLLEEELQNDAVARLPEASAHEFAIEVEGGAFSWDGSHDKLSLSNIDLCIRDGATVAVCGMVGSGKSSLLSSLLGEVPKLAGKVKLKGRTAYVGQTAWIQSGRIRDNVLFGSLMDQSKYEQVLEICQLKEDLEVLPYGDQTEIGERGINLSGGQKQRIQLARAVYQNADIYLLDDPFSALDVQTGTQIFKQVVLGALASKTVLLVTHQVDFLPVADFLLVLKGGCITQRGTYQELTKSQADFRALVDEHKKAMDFIEQVGEVAAWTHDEEKTTSTGVSQQEQGGEMKAQGQQLVQEEREKGKVGLGLYWSYCTAYYRGALVPLILLGPLAFQAFQIAGNWWMAKETPATSAGTASVESPKLIGVYVALTFGGSLFFLARVLLLSVAGLGTAQIFFFNMLNCIFHAPMSFFDSTPNGRILNRASTDQSALDLDVPFALGGLANSLTLLLCVVGVVSQTLWQVVLVFVLVAIICMALQKYYIVSARELERLKGMQRAPVIHHFSESLAGAATIRGFNQQERFTDRNLALIDSYVRPVFYSEGAMEWVSLRLELLTNVVFAVYLVLLVNLPPGAMDPSLAGLGITYALNIDLPWVISSLCNVERKIISVERIKQYVRIPSEAPWEIGSGAPKGWPSRGTIELINLQVRYTESSPLILHGITCKFPGSKRIGVVGRTGSGKSTLIQAIFRMIEPAGGKILIDDIDISHIGLHDLRSRLSIIPQDPTLFAGTIRYNLDPLGQHSDAELWETLDKSQLADLVRNKGGLDASVSENGENWSMGQRQLLCLGRAMLKRTQILVLDEATASMDTATEAVLQSTVSKQFTGCTSITIAHRLPTVFNSDLVLVLSDGRVVEYDEPTRLLESNSSHFRKLANEYLKRTFQPSHA